MIEILKNVGLGIFINGAYAFQFVRVDWLAFSAVCEGLIIIAAAELLRKGRK